MIFAHAKKTIAAMRYRATSSRAIRGSLFRPHFQRTFKGSDQRIEVGFMMESSRWNIARIISSFGRLVLRVPGDFRLGPFISSFKSCCRASKVRDASPSETIRISSGGQTSMPTGSIPFNVSCAVIAVAMPPRFSGP